MRIEHKHIEALQAVIQSGGFTKAAVLLRTSQPSVSRLIQQLRSVVGFALFTRLDGRTTPTAEALALAEEVERSFLGLDRVMQRARDIRDQRVGRLRIISMPALANAFLPHVLTKFLKDRPGVQASLQVQRSESIAAWIAAQQFDVGFAMLPLDRPGVRTELFDPAPSVCVLPAKHRLARKSFVTARDLAGTPVIASGPNSMVQRAIDRMLEAAGVRFDMQIETPITAIACQFVAAGAGVTIADPFTAAFMDRKLLTARPFRPEVRFEFGLLYPAHAAPSELVRQFIHLVETTRDDMYAGDLARR